MMAHARRRNASWVSSRISRRTRTQLRQARVQRSMVEVAALAGISVETLRKIETGRVPTPAFFTVAAVAEAVGLSLDALRGELDGSRPLSA